MPTGIFALRGGHRYHRRSGIRPLRPPVHRIRSAYQMAYRMAQAATRNDVRASPAGGATDTPHRAIHHPGASLQHGTAACHDTPILHGPPARVKALAPNSHAGQRIGGSIPSPRRGHYLCILPPAIGRSSRRIGDGCAVDRRYQGHEGILTLFIFPSLFVQGIRRRSDPISAGSSSRVA